MQDDSHRNRSAPTSGTAPSFPFAKGLKYRLTLVCMLAGVVLGAAAAISTSVYVWSPQEGKHVTPFCCPGLASELAWYVNQTIDPCRDFFAYVCSNVLRDGQRDEDDLDLQLQQSVITGASTDAAHSGDAGRFLTSFYRSCLRALQHPKSFFRSLASALVHNSWEHQGLVDTREAILYIFTASIKYQLPSVVRVSISEDKSTMVMKSNEICINQTHYYEAMAAVVEALNGRANTTTLSSRSVFRFWDKVCDALSSPWRNIRHYAAHNESNKIQAELWNTDDLDAIFSVYSSLLRSVRIVTAVGVHQIRSFRDQFVSELRNSTAATMKVALLVWHSVVSGAEAFYVTLGSPVKMLFRICESRTNALRTFWEAFAAEVLTSQAKDAAAHALFTSVKRSVYADVRTIQLFEPDDAERLHSFFENMVLITPKEASHISIAVPNASEHLGENILRGNSYDFLVQREHEQNLTDGLKVDYKEVTFLGERELLLSSRIYGYISTGSGDYELPNNSRVGRLLAEALWYMVLVKMDWTPKSLANINRFYKCFLDNYLGNRKTDVTDSFIVLVLGLSSVVNALNKTDWETLKPAWSLWRISNAQFFFMLSTYYGCPWFWWPKTARLTNFSLAYNEEFAKAFQCPFTAPMAKTHHCFRNG